MTPLRRGRDLRMPRLRTDHYGRVPLEARIRSELDLHRDLMQRAGINPE